jgi:hypothetical protein
VMVGFSRLGSRSLSSRNPSVGFLLKYSTSTAERWPLRTQHDNQHQASWCDRPDDPTKKKATVETDLSTVAKEFCVELLKMPLCGVRNLTSTRR